MLYLSELIRQESNTQIITLDKRLPVFITAPCKLHVVYRATLEGHFYLLHLKVHADLHINCQRCMEAFPYSYDNETTIAICKDEDQVDSLMKDYECIVAPQGEIDLSELITDELHLYAPQCHARIKDCDGEISQFLSGKK